MVSQRFKEAYVPEVVPDSDLQYFDKAEHGARMGWGTVPALLIVDMTMQFTSDEYPLGRSDTSRDTIKATRRLLKAARHAEIPIMYTRGMTEERNVDVYRGIKDEKKERQGYDPGSGNEIHPLLEPREDEIVIEKPRPSAFFDTHLANMLRQYGVDTIVITGMTTSGCVRASVVDAHSSNFRPIVPIECVADRSKISHEVTLFDLDMKYADVTSLHDTLEHLHADT